MNEKSAKYEELSIGALSSEESNKKLKKQSRYGGFCIGVSIILILVPIVIVITLLNSKKSIEIPDLIEPQLNPVAYSDSIIISGNARFTILTPHVIRLEYTEESQFEDRATLFAVNRRIKVPEYTFNENLGTINIETLHLILSYTPNEQNSLTPSNLEIYIKDSNKFWYPGISNHGQLTGTIRTLDSLDGFSKDLNCSNLSSDEIDDSHCQMGIISRDGWVLLDDSDTAILSDKKTKTNDNVNWQWCERRNINKSNTNIDLYFFGHGQNYNQALTDFTLISGRIALPPRYVFGIWYSRYWEYSDRELMDLVNEYQRRNIPLDILVTDMDWHNTDYMEYKEGKTDLAGQSIGWSGYTWQKSLFPDPNGYLKWLKKHNLRITLNIHPASGVQPTEEKYDTMCNALGIPPSNNPLGYVKYDIENLTWTEAFMNVIFRPLEQDGVDFWWLDWQQGENTTEWAPHCGINPTFWLNHVFFTTPLGTWNDKRPLVFHRWGGLGNHRYQIGFSGDVVPHWDSLRYEIQFTSSAANVLFGYWSHDLGGHTDYTPPELYTRWIQFGLYSPIFRTHGTKLANAERRIWLYPNEYYEVMRECMILRERLVPFLYSEAWITHLTGKSLIYPIYYEYPLLSEAYDQNDQYFFSKYIMVSPITTPIIDGGLIVEHKIWIPPKNNETEGWLEWYTGKFFPSESTSYYSTSNYTLQEIPMLIKVGSIIPLALLPRTTSHGLSSSLPLVLELVVVPSSVVSTYNILYDDDGVDLSHNKGHVAATILGQGFANEDTEKRLYTISAIISPTSGTFGTLPRTRAWFIRFVSVLPPTKVTIDDNIVHFCTSIHESYYNIYERELYEHNCWIYDSDKMDLIVFLPFKSIRSKRVVIATLEKTIEESRTLTHGLSQKFTRLLTIKDILWKNDIYAQIMPHFINALESPRKIDSIIYAHATTGNNILISNLVESEIYKFNTNYSKIHDEITALDELIPLSVKTKVLSIFF